MQNEKGAGVRPKIKNENGKPETGGESLISADGRSCRFMGEDGRGLAVAKAGTGRFLNLPEMYRNELNCTHLPLNSGDFNKKIISRKRHASARSGRYNRAGVARAWGGQNEAKTKPFCDAAGAIDRRAGLANRHCLQGEAAFQPVLRCRARHGENYRTKPFMNLRWAIYDLRGAWEYSSHFVQAGGPAGRRPALRGSGGRLQKPSKSDKIQVNPTKSNQIIFSPRSTAMDTDETEIDLNPKPAMADESVRHKRIKPLSPALSPSGGERAPIRIAGYWPALVPWCR